MARHCRCHGQSTGCCGPQDSHSDTSVDGLAAKAIQFWEWVTQSSAPPAVMTCRLKGLSHSMKMLRKQCTKYPKYSFIYSNLFIYYLFFSVVSNVVATQRETKTGGDLVIQPLQVSQGPPSQWQLVIAHGRGNFFWTVQYLVEKTNKRGELAIILFVFGYHNQQHNIFSNLKSKLLFCTVFWVFRQETVGSNSKVGGRGDKF